jgi:hypothetical protein
LQIVKAIRAVNHGEDNPTRDKDANNREAKFRKVIVQTANDAPEPTFEAELVADQPEDFDAPNEESNNDRRRRTERGRRGWSRKTCPAPRLIAGY